MLVKGGKSSSSGPGWRLLWKETREQWEFSFLVWTYRLGIHEKSRFWAQCSSNYLPVQHPFFYLKPPSLTSKGNNTRSGTQEAGRGYLWLSDFTRERVQPEQRVWDSSLLSLSKKGLWWLILCVNLAGTQCPDIWSNIILDISVRMFLDEVYIKSVDFG